ncbi:hypothetical protein L2755_19435 [Shewanella abyssi]|uniref:hypothetical protein n=1 Tax=Shewanella abyssi TaxID=311789 RepID=UPI00200C6F2E|nr:hypothetical protein [Shewanella abyssi]MCL1051782.1 hypothetical protein [Shewanella abyssi]
MKKSITAILIAAAMMPNCASAASMDDLRISGFGSIGVGTASNNVGYAGYDEEVDFKQDTLVGLQFDFNINDKAKVTTQLVANGRYDFEPAIEVAYLSYDFDRFTVRGGKMRTPFYMYSDYLDVGYAYPMLRPSQEIYENLIISNYTGVDLLIPITIGDTTLQLQAFTGVSQVEERDSTMGEKGDPTFGLQIDINKVVGATVHWYIDDWTLRYAYAQGETGETGVIEMDSMVANKDATFSSVGLQYNDGSLLVNLEAMSMKLDGVFHDNEGVSGLLGYQIGNFMPYISASWINTTDDEERENTGALQRYERLSYSVGNRWDFAQNMALKIDVTYVDYRDTYGGYGANIEYQNIGGNIVPVGARYDDTFVYSMSVDFVF